jgi:hypothetical protein
MAGRGCDGALTARETLEQDHQHPTRIVLPCAANDTIIGQAEQKAAPLHPWLDLPLQPFLQDKIQHGVRQHEGDHCVNNPAHGLLQAPRAPLVQCLSGLRPSRKPYEHS